MEVEDPKQPGEFVHQSICWVLKYSIPLLLARPYEMRGFTINIFLKCPTYSIVGSYDRLCGLHFVKAKDSCSSIFGKAAVFSTPQPLVVRGPGPMQCIQANYTGGYCPMSIQIQEYPVSFNGCIGHAMRHRYCRITVVNIWNGLPENIVSASSVNIFA
jgi:hypothetical protein